MKKNNIIIDRNNLNKPILIVFIIFIILIITSIIAWYVILNKSRKAKPVVKYTSSDPGEKGKNPLLTAIEIDPLINNNGYSFADLGDPCTNNPQTGAIANLPEAYRLQNCDTTKGLVCADGVYNGAICLSEIGYLCNSINDCVPKADSCINNICSEKEETLNRNCTNDNECKGYVPGHGNRFNHVCDIQPGSKTGLCKYNLFPYDTGCKTSSECTTEENNEIVCNNSSDPVKINVTATGISTIVLEDIINYKNLEDMIITLYNNDDGKTGLFGILNISSWKANKLEATLISAMTTVTAITLTSGKKYILTFGQKNKGVCLSLMPPGAPSNVTIGGVGISCQTGLNSINGYCVQQNPGTSTQVCVEGKISCGEVKFLGQEAQLDCVYNDDLVQTNYNNYNYGLCSKIFDVYKIGVCSLRNNNKGDICDNGLFGCALPYVCLKEAVGANNSNYFCTVPLQAQICLATDCPDGYTCGDDPDTEPPICYSNKDSICLQHGDCYNSNCGGTNNDKIISLSIYDTVVNKYKNLIPSIFRTAADVKTSLSPKTINTTYNGISTAVPEKIIVWYTQTNSQIKLPTNYNNFEGYKGSPGTTYSGIQIIYSELNYSNNTYSASGVSIINFPPTNGLGGTIGINDINNLLIDEDDNKLLIYKKQVNTLRQRMFKINSVVSEDPQFIILNPGSGLLNNDIVYYFNGSGTANLYNPKILYKIFIDNSDPDKRLHGLYNSDSVLDPDLDNIVSPAYTTLSGSHYFVTYSTNYSLDGIYGNKDITGDEYDGSSLDSINNNMSLIYSYTTNLIDDKYYTNINQLKTGDRLLYTETSGGLVSKVNVKDLNTGTDSSNLPGFDTIIPLVNSRNYYPLTIANTGTSVVSEVGGVIKPYYAYNLSDDYHGAAGGCTILKQDADNIRKVFTQTFDYAADNDYFTLYEGIYNYSINNIQDTSEQYIVMNNNYVYDKTKTNPMFQINGFNTGFTKTYDIDDDSSTNFSVKKINGINNIVASHNLKYASFEGFLVNSGVSVSRYVTHIDKISYKITDSKLTGDTFDGGFSKPIDANTNLITLCLSGDNIYQTIFGLDNTNSSSVNNSKGFYFDYGKTDDIITDIANNIDEVKLNPYVDSGSSAFNFLYSLKNTNDINNIPENSTIINNNLEKIKYTESVNNVSLNSPVINYDDFLNFPELQPIDCSGFKEVSTVTNAKENYFASEQSKLFLRNEDDINTVLNYSSSEIVFMLVTQTTPYPAGINFVVVNIAEYNVTIDEEFMIIDINVPVPYVANKDLFDINNWKICVHNIVPMVWSFLINDAKLHGMDDLSFNLVRFNDSSIFYTSTKSNDWFLNKNSNYSRTGYNKFLQKNTGLEFPNSANNPLYSVYDINDGYGVNLGTTVDVNFKKANPETYVAKTNLLFYDINSSVDLNVEGPLANLPNIAPPSTNTGRMPYFTLPLFTQWGITFFNQAKQLKLKWPYPPIAPVNAVNTTTSSWERIGYYPDNRFPSGVWKSLFFTQYIANGNLFNTFFPITSNYTDLHLYQELTNEDANPLTAYPIIDGRIGTDNVPFNKTTRFYDNITPPLPANFYTYSGIIKLSMFYARASTFSISAVNNLFLSTMPVAGNFLYNSTIITQDNLISNIFYDTNGKKKYKNLGDISFYTNTYPRYQTGTSKNDDYFSEANQIIASWPTWFKERYTDKINKHPKILKIIFDSNDGNYYNKLHYYAFIEYNGNRQLLYMSSESINNNLGITEGIATTPSIFNPDSGIDNAVFNNQFKMSSPSNLLFVISNRCL